MNVLKGLGIAAGAILLVLVAGGMLLPREVRVERSATMSADAEQVYAIVNDMHQFNRWSPWYERDPDAEYKVEGPTSGVGQIMSWASEKQEVGVGSQEIVESQSPEFIRTRLSFEGQGDAEAYIRIDPADSGQVEVTWGFETDMGFNPIGRYMGLMMDAWVGGDYERGLGNLKALVESDAAPDQG